MPAPRLASVCLAVLVLGAGCLSGLQPDASPDGTASPDSSSDESVPPFPEKPANLSQGAAIEYATAYERATKYREVHAPGAEVALTCDATLDEATANGYYVVAACGGSVTFSDGSHGDIAPADHAYFVNESETIRIDATYLRNFTHEDVYTSTNESENLRRPAGLSHWGFEVLNFDDADHTVTVEVTYLNETASPRIFSQSYSVGAHDGVVQPGVTARKGTYVVSVRLETGETATYRWRLSESRADRVAIVITTEGAVEARPSPKPM